MPRPHHVDVAYNKAEAVAKHDPDTWQPSTWSFPTPTQADKVWDTLSPVRDHIEQRTGVAVQRNPDAKLPREVFSHVESALLDTELQVHGGALVAEPNGKI